MLLINDVNISTSQPYQTTEESERAGKRGGETDP